MLVGSPPECAERPGKDGKFPRPKLNQDIKDQDSISLIRKSSFAVVTWETILGGHQIRNSIIDSRIDWANGMN